MGKEGVDDLRKEGRELRKPRVHNDGIVGILRQHPLSERVRR
jgi:hypothetical protein